MAVAPCGTLYDPHRPPSDRHGAYSTVTSVTSVSTAYRHDPTAPARTTARITAWIAVPTAYAVRRHRSPAPVTHPSAFVTSRHPPVTAHPNPGVSPGPSFRISHGIWHSVTSGGMLGRG
ncbi:hypothetical protein GCM10017779_10380 [Streptomyces capillispiralis]|nr:hypothetical protein GCM10017779_10380 [Streptomyces capillispiralis]